MNAPIFIVGPPRSGTTLTAKILGRHSRIFIPGETHFFEDIYARRHTLGSPTAPGAMAKIVERLSTVYARFNEPADQERVVKLLMNPVVAEQLKAPCTHYGEVFSRFMEIQMSHEGKTRWGNKVPSDLFRVKDIWAFYPDAQIIACVRDPRDFLLSYKEKWRTATSHANAERLRKLYHPVVTTLLWKASLDYLAMLQKRVSPDKLFILRYEDLASHPEEMARQLCEFLKEPYEANIITGHYSNTSGLTAPQGDIYTSSIGRFRDALSPEEILIGQAIGRKHFHDYGYQPEDVIVNIMKIALLFFSTPYALIRAFYVNREKYGSFFPYLLRRVWVLLGRDVIS